MLSLAVHGVLLWPRWPAPLLASFSGAVAARHELQASFPQVQLNVRLVLKEPFKKKVLNETRQLVTTDARSVAQSMSKATRSSLRRSLPAPQPMPLSAPSVSSTTNAVSEATALLGSEVDANGLREYRLGLALNARQFKSYLVQAVQQTWRGRVDILFVIDANGRVQPLRLIASSGHTAFDLAALEMLSQAAQATLMPESLRGREFSFLVPVEFAVP